MESTRGSVWSTTSQAYCNECLMTIQRQRVDRALRYGPVAVKSGGFEEFPMWFCFIDEQKSEASWRLILLPCQVSPCAELDQVNSDPFTVTARGSSYQGWVQDSVEGLRSKKEGFIPPPPFQSRWGWGGGFRRIFEGKEPNILGDILEEEGILILFILKQAMN